MDPNSLGGEDTIVTGEKRVRLNEIIEEDRRQTTHKISEKRSGREAVMHRREVRERKEREKREREISERKAKKTTGAKYWEDKFREMAEKHSKNKIEVVL